MGHQERHKNMECTLVQCIAMSIRTWYILSGGAQRGFLKNACFRQIE